MAGSVVSAVLKLEDRNFTSNAKKANKTLDDTQRRSKHASNEFRNFGRSAVSGFKSFAGGTAKLAGAIGVIQGVRKGMNELKNSISSATDRIDTMDRFNRVVGDMTDDTDAAKKAMGRLEDITEGTAMRMDTMADGVQNFVSSGMDVKGATNVVESFGNAVAKYGDGSDEQFQRVTSSLRKMSTKGKVSMEDLMTIQDAGIQPLKAYADETGKTKGAVQEALSSGKIKAEDFIQTVSGAMMDGTKNFKSVAGAMEEEGATWSSVMSIVRSKTDMAMADFIQNTDKALENNGLPDLRTMIQNVGDRVSGMVQKAANRVPQMVGFFTNLYEQSKPGLSWLKDTAMPAIGSGIKFAWEKSKQFSSFIIGNWDQIGPVAKYAAVGIGALVTSVKTVNTATRIFNGTLRANPIGAVASLVTSLLVPAAIYLYQNWDTVKEKTMQLWDKLGPFKGVVKALVSPFASVIAIGVKLYKNWDTIKEKTASLVAYVPEKVGNMKDSVVGFFGNLKTGAVNKIDSMVGWIKGFPQRLASGIRKGYSKIKSAAEYIGRALTKPLFTAIDGITYGIGWVLDKVGATGTGKKFMDWDTADKIPGFAKGTDNHKGGLARVSDGKGKNKQELISTPGGGSFLSPKQETVMNLPKGTSVLDGNSTASMMSGGVPGYAGGIGWVKNMWGKTKDFFKKTGEIIAHPIKAAKGAVSKYVDTDGLKGITKKLVPNTANTVVDKGTEWLKDKIAGSGDDGSGVNPFGKGFTKTSGYGKRDLNGGEFHKGIDFGADIGTIIKAATGGTVKHAGAGGTGSGYGGYGKSVSVQKGAHELLYGHMSKVIAKEGKKIKAGDVIGEVGQTGQATGPHVHFEARKAGTLDHINPDQFLGGGSKSASKWKPQVKKALAANDLSTSKDMVNKVIKQIETESGGDPKAKQKVKDVNSGGNEARGLMQVTPTTFSEYAHKGHTKMTRGYDGLLAGLAYAKSRYGSNLSALGKGHGYKKGTNYVPEDQPAYLHKGEAVVPKEHNKPGKGDVYLTIENINAKGTTADEILNEFVPKLKMRLANM